MMKIQKFFEIIFGLDFLIGKNTSESTKMLHDFLEKYPFVTKDADYLEFLREINGISLDTEEYNAEIYGFAMPIPEMIIPIEDFMMADGYLVIAGYCDKVNYSEWKGISYYLREEDDEAMVYCKFHTDHNDYIPICVGFKEMMHLILFKDYKTQYNRAYKLG